MPQGIGVRKTGEGNNEVIVDPMTNEIICKTETEDGGKKVAKVNDSWFVLNFKLRWKDLSKASAEEGGGNPEAAPAARPSLPSPARAPAPRKKTAAPAKSKGVEE
jgi:hypothetical protein